VADASSKSRRNDKSKNHIVRVAVPSIDSSLVTLAFIPALSSPSSQLTSHSFYRATSCAGKRAGKHVLAQMFRCLVYVLTAILLLFPTLASSAPVRRAYLGLNTTVLRLVRDNAVNISTHR
jgi:hypothetical protein